MLNKICRNYLWGGKAEYQKSPFISWSQTCSPKKYGGLGLKNLGAWNKACIAKTVWAIALKRDTLWVRWVHGRYIKHHDWMEYHPPNDSSWYWKKLVATKDLFKAGVTDRSSWQWQGQSKYTISQGYHWLLGEKEYKKWSKAIWASPVLPRHSSTAWFLINRKLPVKSRLAKFMGQSFDMSCGLSGTEQEDIDHLFFRCTWVTDL